MTPLELQIKWQLTNSQIAAALGKSEETIKSYKASAKARSHRNVPESVRILCKSLDRNWEGQGKAEIYLCTA
jgi:DNA-binding CsgD family transcriptional regulator